MFPFHKETIRINLLIGLIVGHGRLSEILQEMQIIYPYNNAGRILERTREMLDAEIPESFKQGMREIARGEVIELDEALEELEQPGENLYSRLP